MKTLLKIAIISFVIHLLSFSFLNAQNKGENIIIGKYDQLHSKILNEERTLLISLPEGYEQSPTKFPVLFILDGNKEVLAETYSIISNLSWSTTPRMIIVAVTNTNRNSDMLPGQGSGEASKFLNFFSEELIPYIENNYKADNYRIIYGASNAGLFVIYSMLEKPETFSAYLTSSPTIIWRNNYMINKAQEFISSKSKLDKFLYVVYGDKEWIEARDSIRTYIPYLESLQSNGLRLKTSYLPEEEHVPIGSLTKGLTALFDGYQYPNEKRRKEGLDSLNAFYSHFSKRLGYQFRIPPRTLIGLGQSLLARNNTKEALDVFQLYNTIYPGDGFCDIMFALTYFKSNNMELAKKYYLKTKGNKSLEAPPFPEWEEMKKKFE